MTSLKGAFVTLVGNGGCLRFNLRPSFSCARYHLDSCGSSLALALSQVWPSKRFAFERFLICLTYHEGKKTRMVEASIGTPVPKVEVRLFLLHSYLAYLTKVI